MRRPIHRPRRLGVLLLAATVLMLSALISGGVLRDASAAHPDRGRDARGLCAISARIALAAEARLDTALSILVADGTLTQDQADAVVATLVDPTLTDLADTAVATPATDDTSRRGFLANRAQRCAAAAQNAQATARAVSDLLGLDLPEITGRLAAGESLAEIAASEGISRADLVAALQTGALARLDAAEAAGAITPEERTDREAAVLTRIETLIDRHRGDRLNETEATPATT